MSGKKSPERSNQSLLCGLQMMNFKKNEKHQDISIFVRRFCDDVTDLLEDRLEDLLGHS